MSATRPSRDGVGSATAAAPALGDEGECMMASFAAGWIRGRSYHRSSGGKGESRAPRRRYCLARGVMAGAPPSARSVTRRISNGYQSRIRGPNVPVPRHTISVIPDTS